MTPALRELVRRRAADRCEYCRISQAASVVTFHVEHIVAAQHGGGSNEANLALACNRCNFFKGPNLSAIDPQTGNVVRLFHPRLQIWHEHLQQVEFVIDGLTDVGRATARLLNMNAEDRVELRRLHSLDQEIA